MAEPNAKLPIVIFISGPTATGKSAVASIVAKELDGAVICADSMQIYKHLDIGTAKPSAEERARIKHCLYDIAEPNERFSVVQYVDRCRAEILRLTSENTVPIVCGGTGQYISALIDGVSFLETETDLVLREKIYLELESEGAERLIEEIAKSDAEFALSLHPNNKKKIVRAVELLRASGMTQRGQTECSLPKEKPYTSLLFVLNSAQRGVLYDRIDSRADSMLRDGLLEEAKYVFDNKESFATASQAIGYKEFFPYFTKTETFESCAEKFKQHTRNYAKRQLTWLKKRGDAIWLDADTDSRQLAGLITGKYMEAGLK
ncbi:MAG: tRNA (adenosine(37)-N6)-dimethylallyltransferase MiaA [Oscillospiraceae bacterium]